MISRTTDAFFMAVCILLMCGCSESLPTLQGKVTIDGNPPPNENISGSTISFEPVGGKGGATTYALIQPDGSYEVKTGATSGMAQGEYRVRIATVIGIPAPPTPDNPNPKLNLWAPARYNNYETSGLTVTVGPGENIHNFELTSD